MEDPTIKPLSVVDEEAKQNSTPPELYGASFKFSQEGNTLGTTEEVEGLELRLEFQLGEKYQDGAFYVIKTDGWSFDNLDEIQALINRAEKVLKKK